MRHRDLLDISRSVLLLVDAQERLLPAIHDSDQLRSRLAVLVTAAKRLDLPVLVTEQYPKGLGPTLSELTKILGDFQAWEKTSFSACGVESLATDIQSYAANQILLAGVETHVCVQQTAMDLAAAGLSPYVLADAVGSRRQLDWQTALERMRRSGVTITTIEAALFELMIDSKNDAFKDISKLIR